MLSSLPGFHYLGDLLRKGREHSVTSQPWVSEDKSTNLFLFNILLIYFWLRWVFVSVHGLLIAVASLVEERGLWSPWAH